MKHSKHEREKFRIIEKYSVLMFIAALFMCVGYASITGDVLKIEGTVSAVAQEGVFITDVVYDSNDGADTANSKINYYLGTALDSNIMLGGSASYIKYKVTVYNSTDKEQLFIGTMVDSTIPNTYTNENIEYVLDGIQQYNTVIPPTTSIDFYITFKYKENVSTENGILKSILNFRFLENPILKLSNENKTYSLKGIYPDATPKEYQFTVSNYTESGVNSVPMTYYLETQIDSPLTAKIYNQSGNEVNGNIILAGDGQTQVSHTYTLKIFWDNSNPESGIAYDSLDYIDKAFECLVNLKAAPSGDNSSKYSGYSINKKFDVYIKTTQFHFDVILAATSADVVNDEAIVGVTLKNNAATTDYTDANIVYEIKLLDSRKYSLQVEDSNNGILAGNSANENVVNLKFVRNANIFMYPQDDMVVEITTLSPFKTQIRKTVTLNKDDANTAFGFRNLRVMTQEDCEGWWNSDTYENLCGDNNGQFEFDEDGALVLDENNMISYVAPSDSSIFSEGYGVCFTMKANVMQGDRYANAILSIGDGSAEYLSWIGVYKGYLHVFAYREGNAGADFAQATTEAGFISYDIKQYNNTIVNIQVSARRQGSMALYINGVKVASCNTGRINVPADYIVTGDLRPLRGLKFNGLLYDLEVYKQILNDDRVLANYEYAKKTWIDNQ